MDWLLVTTSTPASASSSLRVHVWRKLRSLGALYIQQSVCLLPERPETRKAVSRLAERVRAEGGQARVVAMKITDARSERELIEEFRAERAEEYAEFLPKTKAFRNELRTERARGRVTYAEVEENEADLERLRKWLRAIAARDYFDAAGRKETEEALKLCQDDLEAFEAEALEIELPAGETTRRRQRNLRSVEGGR